MLSKPLPRRYSHSGQRIHRLLNLLQFKESFLHWFQRVLVLLPYFPRLRCRQRYKYRSLFTSFLLYFCLYLFIISDLKFMLLDHSLMPKLLWTVPCHGLRDIYKNLSFLKLLRYSCRQSYPPLSLCNRRYHPRYRLRMIPHGLLDRFFREPMYLSMLSFQILLKLFNYLFLLFIYFFYFYKREHRDYNNHRPTPFYCPSRFGCLHFCLFRWVCKLFRYFCGLFYPKFFLLHFQRLFLYLFQNHYFINLLFLHDR